VSLVFIGAGPGDPGLLTVRGQRTLAEAQVVVFDARVAPALLEGVDDSAERIRVGDDVIGVPRAAVPPVLVARASAGLRVARLLAGDAGDFGEEAMAVATAGVAFEVVPGVSFAVAGAAYAGIPVAHAGVAGSAAVLDAADPGGIAWERLGEAADTLLIRVSGAALSAVVTGLIRGGRPPDTRAALISEVATFRQRTLTGRLG
jgi:siroheme synthase